MDFQHRSPSRQHVLCTMAVSYLTLLYILGLVQRGGVRRPPAAVVNRGF